MRLRILCALLLMIGVSACSSSRDMGTGSGTPGHYKVGQPYEIDGIRYVPREDYRYSETGIASWYGPGFEGKRTANGETFDPSELTAAHRTLPMPSLVRVVNLDNGKSIVVRINDRGPFANNRIIDLSKRAADLLGFTSAGTAKVRVDIMEIESRAIADAAKKRGYIAPPRTQVAKTDTGFIMPQPEMQDGEGITETAKVDAVESVPLEQPMITPVGAAPVQPVMIKPVLTKNKTVQAIAPTKKATAMPTPLVREPKPASVPGHEVNGRFYPEAHVKHVKIKSKQQIYVQAGAFGQKENALRLKQSLGKIAKANLSEVHVNGKKLFRVRLGPIKDVKEADRVLAKVLPQSKQARITVE